MTDPAVRVTEFRDAIQGEGSINCDVTRIGALSRFDERFESYDFRYEKPFIILELDNRIENIQVLVSMEHLVEEPLKSLFQDSSISDVIGSSINMKVDSSFKKIYLENHDKDLDSKTPEYRPRVKKTSKVKFAGERVGLLRTRTNRIKRANRIITNTFTRHNDRMNWMEVKLRYKEKNDKTVVYAVRDDVELTAEWSFENGVKGTSMLQEFADSLSAIQLLDNDVGTCSAWIKPIWDLEPSETRDEIFVSDDEYWVVSEGPRENNSRSLKDVLLGFTGLWSEERRKILGSSDVREAKSAKYCGVENWHVKS